MNRSSTLALAALTLTALSACVPGAPEESAPEGEEVAESEQAVGTVVSHFNWNGGNADVGFGDGTSWTSVGVYEGGTRQDRRVSLNFWRSTVDPTSYECTTEQVDWDGDGIIDESWEWCDYRRGTYEYGWAEIPSSAAKLSKTAANVNIDLATVANAYRESCSWDRSDPNGWSCTTGAAKGVFNLTWQRNGEYSSTQNGMHSYNYGEYSYRSMGVSSHSSATVSGQAFGATVDANGSIGSGKNVSIDRIRN